MDSFVEVLAAHAERRPEALSARFVEDEGPATELSYGDLLALARRWAAHFQATDLEPGEAVILSLPNVPDFPAAYFGALIAGAVPVPVAPVSRADPADPRQRMVAERLRFLGARHIVVPAGSPDVVVACSAAAPPGTRVLSSDTLPEDGSAIEPLQRADPEALGLIQFSSGTSGTAKAVELTNRALLRQAALLSEALATRAGADSAVSWLPFFHDMGLIGFLLTPLYIGGSVTVLRTEAFLRNPRVWPRAITRFRPSVTGGPPSAYGLLARFVREAERRDYDLGSLRAALVGAETIEPATLRAFADAFHESGLRPEALMPAYGLAENGLAVTMSPLGSGLSVDVVDVATLQAEGRAAPADGAARREIASVGEPLPGTEVVIADPSGRHLEDRRVGEILVQSGSLMRGYHGGVDSTIRDGWLWTGDIGYRSEGRLYITGRAKEVLIVGGANFYPDDLERVAGAVTGVRQGRAVAFSVPDMELSTESVIVLVETALREPASRDRLRDEVRRSLTAAGLPVHRVGLIEPRAIRSTDTGKPKRVETRQRYLAGELDGTG